MREGGKLHRIGVIALSVILTMFDLLALRPKRKVSERSP